ncbi:MAG: ABC transporter ATP-binding protein [Anaerolineales bacterium]|nr:ABC transporter ATP-binding protein [Anaerolineales bacterium]
MTTVISVENLSKIYRLGQIGTGTFANDLKVWWARTRGKPNPLLRIGETDHGNRNGEDVWALKGVSFQVQQGEALGIIGRNGAGKSTLLKILSRITAPTSGQVKVKGRIASLLEVGTGFHPELTGRENTYLNGAILGMKREEITRKFDEIVDFAGIEKFIDTPVKRYSSGMYVRLAFAVAAHLDPEILVVDEVLAVGDVAFQKKCLGKMGDVAQEGRTVLFVSHNMAAVMTLCQRLILLENGNLSLNGDPHKVISRYYDRLQLQTNIQEVHRTGSGKAKFISASLLNEDGTEASSFIMGHSLFIEMWAESAIKTGVQFALVINDHYGRPIIHAVDQDDSFQAQPDAGVYKIRVQLGNLSLYPGEYTLSIWCGYEKEDYDYVHDYLRFTVEQGAISSRTTHMSGKQAVFFAQTKWENLLSE